jgi:hypothetical protein
VDGLKERDQAYEYVALSGLSSVVGMPTQGFALGYQITPFQGW